MKFKKAFILFLIILLTACDGKQVHTVVPLPTASVTIPTTKASPSQTPTLSFTETLSPTPEPEATIPIATLNAIATIEPIRIKLISQNPELAEYIAFCHPTYCYGVDVSPNGRWAYFSNGNVIEIFEIDGKRVGKYSRYEIYGRDNGYGNDYYEGYVDIVHWSKDGRYSYIATQHGDGGPGSYFGYKTALVRVNLQNGTWKSTGISGVLSFSLDDKYIVYSTNVSEIRVRNIQSGEEKIYFSPKNYLYFGEFVWSPDGGRIIFVSTSEDWDGLKSKYALFMIDLESNKIVSLYEGVGLFYYPVEWAEDKRVSLGKYLADGKWTLDLSTSPPKISP